MVEEDQVRQYSSNLIIRKFMGSHGMNLKELRDLVDVEGTLIYLQTIMAIGRGAHYYFGHIVQSLIFLSYMSQRTFTLRTLEGERFSNKTRIPATFRTINLKRLEILHWHYHTIVGTYQSLPKIQAVAISILTF